MQVGSMRYLSLVTSGVSGRAWVTAASLHGDSTTWCFGPRDLVSREAAKSSGWLGMGLSSRGCLRGLSLRWGLVGRSISCVCAKVRKVFFLSLMLSGLLYGLYVYSHSCRCVCVRECVFACVCVYMQLLFFWSYIYLFWRNPLMFEVDYFKVGGSVLIQSNHGSIDFSL